MFRYHFVIEGAGTTIQDPTGLALPDDAAALAHGERLVQKVKFPPEAGDSSVMLTIKKQGYDAIRRIPLQSTKGGGQC